MAYQKLNAGRVLRIVFSDTIPIPNIATRFVSGSATATTSGKLVDSTKNFITLGVKVGNIIYNTTDNTAATVTAVDSATTLSVSANVFASGEVYSIFAEEEKNGVTFLLGGHGADPHGSVRVLTAGEDDVVISGLTHGTYVPIQIKKIFSTSTDIDSAYALW
jgi:hypothetical protein